MSILIKGMEMPENCYLCRLGDQEFGIRCRIVGEAYINTSNKPSLRPSWCPLIEVPTPHGRLKDVDVIIKNECHSCDGSCEVIECDCLTCTNAGCDTIRALNDATTIIEAEE